MFDRNLYRTSTIYLLGVPFGYKDFLSWFVRLCGSFIFAAACLRALLFFSLKKSLLELLELRLREDTSVMELG